MNMRFFYTTSVFFFIFAAAFVFPATAKHDPHSAHGVPGMEMKADGSNGQVYTAAGVVKNVDKVARKITIAHEPVPALGWPAMTMDFVFKDASLAEEVKAGDKARFDFRNAGKTYIIVDIEARK
ncbi:hypothetical protein AGMMS49974_01240 [Deltaproteobacteria bacterium]|nr:hypothetical protein AGMMS49925_00220 [Deltaproteobacteria bacterium]GHU93464.1 hypothetical protein AGMMS49974_01240 [Deltaproteobacteria bacterium]